MRRTRGDRPELRGTDREADRLFGSLTVMANAMTAGSKRNVLDEARFEHLVDHLLISEPDQVFGRSRFAFCGSTIAESSRMGDVTDLKFGELIVDEPSRAVMAAYRHVLATGLGVTTRNQPVVGAATPYISRMIVPLFHGSKVALMVSTVLFHDEPIVVPPPR